MNRKPKDILALSRKEGGGLKKNGRAWLSSARTNEPSSGFNEGERREKGWDDGSLEHQRNLADGSFCRKE